MVCDKSSCTGCWACVNSCDENAITMELDPNGFLYPHIDEAKCIQCGKCHYACPVLFPESENNTEPKCYAAMAEDSIRMVSSSGGAFTVLAEEILSRGGLVCGAAFNNDGILVHKLIDNISELDELRKSKYVQSEVQNTYQEIDFALNRDRYVLFVGCPCQVAGLQKYLNMPYSKLYTVDIVCHGTPSLQVFNKFLESITCNRPSKVNFRYKNVHGWTPSLQVSCEGEEVYYRPSWECPFYKAFLSIMCCRESCGACKFNRLPRQGDFTLADFWGIGEVHPDLDDHKGTSLVLINNDKAAILFENIKNKFIKCVETDINIARKQNWNVFGSSKAHPERARFLKLLKTHSFTDALNRVENRWFDVALVGWWYGKNYGSALTSFALHEVLESLGYDTLMVEWPYTRKPYPVIPDTEHRRFAKREYSISSQRVFEELPQLNNHVEQFVVGSDQLWNYSDFKQTGYYYMLDFVRPYRKKISIATSFGHATYNAPPEVIEHQKLLLKDFDFVSVRENSGKTICKSQFGVDATVILDPVFICDIKSYHRIMIPPSVQSDYLLAYILSPDLKIGEKLVQLSTELNLKLIVLVDGQTDFDTNCKSLGLPEFCVKATMQEWLGYICNARAIITDSYHGTCFAVIFNKPFIAIPNSKRGLTRFENLAETIPVRKCYKDSVEQINSSDMIDIDFTEINSVLNREKDHSLAWIKGALSAESKVRESHEMISDYELNSLRHINVAFPKWHKYADLFKTIYLNKITTEDIDSWLQANNYATFSIYGNMFLSDLFKGDPVSKRMSYIVENNNVDNITTLPRNTECFPHTDIMVIVDVLNYTKIQQKLSTCFSGRVITIEALIDNIILWKNSPKSDVNSK